MPRCALTLIAFLATASAAVAQPSADDILKATRQALGGSKLPAVESLAVSGQAASSGIQSDMTLSIQLPDKFLREQTVLLLGGSIPGVGAEITPEVMAQVGQPVVVDCINGDQQWSDIRMSADSQIASAMVERAGASLLNARRQDLRRTFARFLLALLLADRPDFRIQFTYVNQATTPDGGPADVLDGTGPGDFAIRLVIDAGTRLPLMMSYFTGADNATLTKIWLSKYKEEGGILIPHLMSWMQGSIETERFEIKKVRINPKFPDNKFVKQ